MALIDLPPPKIIAIVSTVLDILLPPFIIVITIIAIANYSYRIIKRIRRDE